jgi:hypothetical protein
MVESLRANASEFFVVGPGVPTNLATGIAAKDRDSLLGARMDHNWEIKALIGLEKTGFCGIGMATGLRQLSCAWFGTVHFCLFTFYGIPFGS